MLSVEVVNEQNGNSSLPIVQRVIVEISNFRMSLLKRQTHRVVVSYLKVRRTCGPLLMSIVTADV